MVSNVTLDVQASLTNVVRVSKNFYKLHSSEIALILWRPRDWMYHETGVQDDSGYQQ